jgi:hypothetical protein
MTIVHLTNGDAAAERLRAAGLPGEVIVWADVLHDGPMLDAGADDEAWRRRRAAFLVSAGHAPEPEALALLGRWDADVARASDADEAVLWFEPDLFDQLLLVRHLARVASRSWTPRALSLVCRDVHPTLGDVTSLGTISVEAARTLYAEREPLGAAAFDLAAQAWRALCASGPEGLLALHRRDTPALPFLEDAIERLLAEYPSAQEGTSLTEHFVLQALDPWPLEGGQVFRAVQRLERHVFMGDTSFFWRLWVMTRAAHPLIAAPGVDGPAGLRFAKVGLTQAGISVRRGESDAVTLNGIDRWVGGVHMKGDSVPWRWDRAARTLVGRT